MKLNHAEISGVSLGFPPSVGVVLTMVPTKGPDAYQGYDRNYGSYQSDVHKPQMSDEDAVRALDLPPVTGYPDPARTPTR